MQVLEKWAPPRHLTSKSPPPQIPGHLCRQIFHMLLFKSEILHALVVNLYIKKSVCKSEFCGSENLEDEIQCPLLQEERKIQFNRRLVSLHVSLMPSVLVPPHPVSPNTDFRIGLEEGFLKIYTFISLLRFVFELGPIELKCGVQ